MKLLITLLIVCAFIANGQGQDFATKADRYLKPYVETGNFSGTVLIAEKGKIIFHKGYGLASVELNVPNGLQTKYHIASVSKTFTAAAILLLEQRGLLTTDDLLSKYIPDYPLGDKITLHHLLSHTSGITNVNNLPEYNDASLKRQTPESLIILFKSKPLEFQPGEKYQYSNSNYNVLAFIIEKVSGKRYGEFLHDEIFVPLKMESTFHHDDATQIITNAAEGYASNGNFGLQKSAHLDWSSKTGNGSLVTTASDLLLWDRALYTEKILSAPAKAKMFRQYAGSGYGWYLGQKHDRDCIYMNGRSPGFSSHIGRYPSDELCVVVLQNSYVSVATQVGFDLAGIALQENVDIPNLRLSKVKKEESDMVTGKYQFAGDFYQPNFLMTISEKNGSLFSDWGELIPGETFHYIQRAFWSKVVFVKNPQGNVLSMTFDTYEGKKIN
ncbi:MAG TPA: serine hydrolase domain-containing protein [Cyclobacteriaceae bacterium]|nr:serine hydrolase domain-containing protein [Cyclobacteriaceae bacterium]